MYSEYICLLRTELSIITKRMLWFSRSIHMSFACTQLYNLPRTICP